MIYNLTKGKRLISFLGYSLCCVLISFGHASCNKSAEPIENKVPDKPIHVVDTLEKFMLGMYVAPPREYTIDRHYEAIRDAHINVIQDISEHYSPQEKTAMLVMAAKYGIKMMVADQRMKGSDADISGMIKQYNAYESTIGYYIKDEPVLSELADAAYRYQKALDFDPYTIPHVNLFPSYATGALGRIDYEKDYVEKWIQMVGPKNLKYLSFDNYPFMTQDSLREDLYYHDLDVIRRMGLKYNIKTSAYLQSIGTSIGLRRPNADELRYSAFTNLAYGIKFPVWFTYWTPTGGEHEQFLNAIVDTKGNKTDLYEPFKLINAELMQLGPVLINLNTTGVYHTGKKIPKGTSRPGNNSLIQANNQDISLIIAEFKELKGSKQYVMLVNKSLKKEEKLILSVNGQKSISEVSKVNGSEVSIGLSNQQFESTFKPGEGKLFRVF